MPANPPNGWPRQLRATFTGAGEVNNTEVNIEWDSNNSYWIGSGGDLQVIVTETGGALADLDIVVVSNVFVTATGASPSPASDQPFSLTWAGLTNENIDGGAFTVVVATPPSSNPPAVVGVDGTTSATLNVTDLDTGTKLSDVSLHEFLIAPPDIILVGLDDNVSGRYQRSRHWIDGNTSPGFNAPPGRYRIFASQQGYIPKHELVTPTGQTHNIQLCPASTVANDGDNVMAIRLQGENVYYGVVWATSDAAGNTVVAGPEQVTKNGFSHLYVGKNRTYYLWFSSPGLKAATSPQTVNTSNTNVTDVSLTVNPAGMVAQDQGGDYTYTVAISKEIRDQREIDPKVLKYYQELPITSWLTTDKVGQVPVSPVNLGKTVTSNVSVGSLADGTYYLWSYAANFVPVVARTVTISGGNVEDTALEMADVSYHHPEGSYKFVSKVSWANRNPPYPYAAVLGNSKFEYIGPLSTRKSGIRGYIGFNPRAYMLHISQLQHAYLDSAEPGTYSIVFNAPIRNHLARGLALPRGVWADDTSGSSVSNVLCSEYRPPQLPPIAPRTGIYPIDANFPIGRKLFDATIIPPDGGEGELAEEQGGFDNYVSIAAASSYTPWLRRGPLRKTGARMPILGADVAGHGDEDVCLFVTVRLENEQEGIPEDFGGIVFATLDTDPNSSIVASGTFDSRHRTAVLYLQKSTTYYLRLASPLYAFDGETSQVDTGTATSQSADVVASVKNLAGNPGSSDLTVIIRENGSSNQPVSGYVWLTTDKQGQNRVRDVGFPYGLPPQSHVFSNLADGTYYVWFGSGVDLAETFTGRTWRYTWQCRSAESVAVSGDTNLNLTVCYYPHQSLEATRHFIFQSTSPLFDVPSQGSRRLYSVYGVDDFGLGMVSCTKGGLVCFEVPEPHPLRFGLYRVLQIGTNGRSTISLG